MIRDAQDLPPRKLEKSGDKTRTTRTSYFEAMIDWHVSHRLVVEVTGEMKEHTVGIPSGNPI